MLIGTQKQICAKKTKHNKVDTIYTNMKGNGTSMMFVFEKGESFNHPTLAIWIEDLEGNYIQPLLVTKSFATGIFRYGPVNDSIWGTEPGVAYRPAALPYWNHKRMEQPAIEKIVPGKGNPVADAYTAATPQENFVLHTRLNKLNLTRYKILLEINQTWDWNEYWTNSKFPGNYEYKTSSQPSLVYAVEVSEKSGFKEYWLNPVGHGHYAGENGHLYTDLSEFTTALNILKSIKVVIEY